MSFWPLLGIGLACLAALSVLVGLSVSAILGQISREVSYLLESQPYGGVHPASTRRTLAAPTWSSSSSPHPANRA